MSPPYLYHRTVPERNVPCESIMIKFTPDFMQPFKEAVGQNVLDELFEERVCSFPDAAEKKIAKMFEEMDEEFQKGKPYREFILQGMLSRMFAAVWEERIPEQFYSENPSLEEVARSVNFSAAYFSRLFREQLGMSYSEYLERIRLRHVSVLLTQTDKSIMEIAQETGYCHGNYLCGQFKKKLGMTPGEGRRRKSI